MALDRPMDVIPQPSEGLSLFVYSTSGVTPEMPGAYAPVPVAAWLHDVRVGICLPIRVPLGTRGYVYLGVAVVVARNMTTGVYSVMETHEYHALNTRWDDLTRTRACIGILNWLQQVCCHYAPGYCIYVGDDDQVRHYLDGLRRAPGVTGQWVRVVDTDAERFEARVLALDAGGELLYDRDGVVHAAMVARAANPEIDQPALVALHSVLRHFDRRPYRSSQASEIHLT